MKRGIEAVRPPSVLRGLGWQWTSEGPIVSVRLDGQRFSVLVPIRDVHAIFEAEAARVGCPCIGAPVSVSGVFQQVAIGGSYWGREHNQYLEDRIAQGNMAFTDWIHIGHPWRSGIWQRLTPANQKALLAFGPYEWLLKKDEPSKLGSLVRNASAGVRFVAKQAVKAVGKITNNPLWNIVATGVSFVPGIGQAVSAGMAGAAAVGRGESLRDIGLAAAKNALPGGPLAAAAFDIAVGVAKGQRLDAAALNAARNQLPGGPVALAAFDAGVAAAKGRSPKQIASAAGRTLASHALPALPPSAPALRVARGIVGSVEDGKRAALQVRQGIKTSRTMAGVQRGFFARQAMAGIVKRAQQGNPMARQVVGAFQGLPQAASPFTFAAPYRRAFA